MSILIDKLFNFLLKNVKETMKQAPHDLFDISDFKFIER